MAGAALLSVTLYMRAACGLCDEVRELLADLHSRFPHRLAEIDIDTDQAAQKKYFDQIPVGFRGPVRPAFAVVIVLERRFAIAAVDQIVDSLSPDTQAAGEAAATVMLSSLLAYTKWLLVAALITNRGRRGHRPVRVGGPGPARRRGCRHARRAAGKSAPAPLR